MKSNTLLFISDIFVTEKVALEAAGQCKTEEDDSDAEDEEDESPEDEVNGMKCRDTRGYRGCVTLLVLAGGGGGARMCQFPYLIIFDLERQL